VGENFGIASRLFLNDAKPSRNSQSKEEEEEEEEKRETPFFSSCVHQQLLRTCSSKFSFLFFSLLFQLAVVVHSSWTTTIHPPKLSRSFCGVVGRIASAVSLRCVQAP
jgi:hypothetical protein